MVISRNKPVARLTTKKIMTRKAAPARPRACRLPMAAGWAGPSVAAVARSVARSVARFVARSVAMASVAGSVTGRAEVDEATDGTGWLDIGEDYTIRAS